MRDRRSMIVTNRHHRGFTLVEVMVAAVITAFVLGSLAMSMSQLARAKDSSKVRLDAHLRADAALEAVRRDVASIIRHDDLYWTRLLIRDGVMRTPIGDLDRDEILIYNTRLSAMNDLDFNGEGSQYETQYRVEVDNLGAMLWQRRDPVPDEYSLAGGVATPMVEGILAIRFEAYDGFAWFQEWDSDEKGLPLAVRITLVASGSRNGEELYDGPFATLRTVVPVDRVTPPAEIFRLRDEEQEAIEDEEGLEDVSDPTADQQQREEAERGGRGGRGRGRRGTGATPGDDRGRGRGGAGEPPPGRGGGSAPPRGNMPRSATGGGRPQ